MAWQDRLSEAAYTSPGGTRQRFDYEDVGRATDKHTATFSFPDAAGTYVQDLGHSGRQFPVRAIFWGGDCDQEADAFELLLLQPGVGKLDHPVYGTVDVVPTGTIKRTDALKTAANQAIVEVTFWETVGVVYPTPQSDPAAAVLGAVQALNVAASEHFGESLLMSTAVEVASFRAAFSAMLEGAKQGLQAIAAADDVALQWFEDVYASITAGLDDLIGTPEVLAAQTLMLVQAPAAPATGSEAATSTANVSARLAAYASLAETVTAEVAEPGYDGRPSNAYHARDLFAVAYVAGSVMSVVNNQFETKAEAVAAAAAVLAQFDDVAAWREDNYAALEQTDPGGTYQSLQDAVALTAGYLVAISFTLKQERRIVLDRARTAVDLVAELYGAVDDELDFFIASNSLTGSEILEIPAGREVAYYV